MGQPCRLFKLAYSAAVDSHGCYPVGHAVGIEPVSKMCLPKTGMFQSMRGDFCRHTQRKKRVGHTETNTVLEKPAVCGLFATFSQVFEITALFGWGGRDRTSEWGNQNPLPYRLATPQPGCARASSSSRGRRASAAAFAPRNPAPLARGNFRPPHCAPRRHPQGARRQ